MPRISGLASVPASIDTDLTTLLSRLTAARAGYLDNLSAGAVALQSTLSSVATDVTTLLARLTATRAGYLDYLPLVNTNLDTTVSSRLAAASTNAFANGNFASDVSGAFSAYSQLVASTAAASKSIVLTLSGASNAAGSTLCRIQLATGAGAAEVPLFEFDMFLTAADPNNSISPSLLIVIPIATRLSLRAATSAAVGATDVFWSINVLS